MMDLGELREEAEEATRGRGHAIIWAAPWHGERGSAQMGRCDCCPGWVQINTLPAPNQINIGGDALALECPIPGTREIA